MCTKNQNLAETSTIRNSSSLTCEPIQSVADLGWGDPEEARNPPFLDSKLKQVATTWVSYGTSLPNLFSFQQYLAVSCSSPVNSNDYDIPQL